ncbi:MAG: glycosyltransferase, partial [Candidatus Roizmanbacteria bacterium]|nr:glycosyltransferase [Candidatus Roizmanbacteria bacterium]
AQFFGCPVIAYKKGGALETVIDGKTGIFFANQNERSLRKAIERFNKIKYNLKNKIREFGMKNIERFSKEKFIDNFLKIL